METENCSMKRNEEEKKRKKKTAERRVKTAKKKRGKSSIGNRAGIGETRIFQVVAVDNYARPI